LAVANHVAAISDNVTMLTLLGELASEEEFVRAQTKPAVEKVLLTVPNTPTIVKRRFLESYPFQKLFEVYVMGDAECFAARSQELSRKLVELLPEFDVVIAADYG